MGGPQLYRHKSPLRVRGKLSLLYPAEISRITAQDVGGQLPLVFPEIDDLTVKIIVNQAPHKIDIAVLGGIFRQESYVVGEIAVMVELGHQYLVSRPCIGICRMGLFQLLGAVETVGG